MQTIDRDRALESEACDAARRIRLVAIKSDGELTDDNRGWFMLFNPSENEILAGEKFDLTAKDVIEIVELVESYRRLDREQKRSVQRLATRMLTRSINPGHG